jgi:hypothetical protein
VLVGGDLGETMVTILGVLIKNGVGPLVRFGGVLSTFVR